MATHLRISCNITSSQCKPMSVLNNARDTTQSWEATNTHAISDTERPSGTPKDGQYIRMTKNGLYFVSSFNFFFFFKMLLPERMCIQTTSSPVGFDSTIYPWDYATMQNYPPAKCLCSYKIQINMPLQLPSTYTHTHTHTHTQTDTHRHTH